MASRYLLSLCAGIEPRLLAASILEALAEGRWGVEVPLRRTNRIVSWRSRCCTNKGFHPWHPIALPTNVWHAVGRRYCLCSGATDT